MGALLGATLKGYFYDMFRSSRKAKKKSPILIIGIVLLAVYVVACLFFSVGAFFYKIGEVFHSSNYDWMYFAFAGIGAVGMGIIVNVFSSQSLIFESKDNEMLLSLPLRPSQIMFSRVVVLHLLSFLCAVLIMLPAGAVYWWYVPLRLTPLTALMFIAMFIVIPFLSTAISLLLGGLIAFISSKVRFKNLFKLIFSLVFLFGYMYLYISVSKYINMLIANGEEISATIRRVLPVFYFMGNAISEGNILHSLIAILSCAVIFAIVYFLLSKVFISIVTTKKGNVRIKYKEKALKTSSISLALLKKELRHFFSSPAYLINASFGCIMTIIIAGAAIVKRELIISTVNAIGLGEDLAPAIIVGMLLLATTDFVSAPSISIEGKSLWIIGSLPVLPEDVLLSKVYTHCVVCIPPSVIASVAISVIFKFDFITTLLVVFSPLIMKVFCAYTGVIINLFLPKLDWINETVAVKQGGSTIVSMLLNFAVLFIPGILYFTVLGTIIQALSFILIFDFLLMICIFFCDRYLRTKGTERFMALM